MTKRIILYHDDADGRCAAAIAGRDAKNWDLEPVYFPMQYGDPLPAGWEDGAASLWMLDFSMPREAMEAIRDEYQTGFVWIDHHQTAIDGLADLADIPGWRDPHTPACLLTWWWTQTPKGPPPRAVELIADRDVWRFRHGLDGHYLHEVYLQRDPPPADPLWDRWLSPAEPVSDLEAGKGLFEARARWLNRYAARLGRPERVHGTSFTMLTVNFPGGGDMGQAIKDLGYDVAHCYVDEVRDGRMVRTHSLYSDVADVGAMAAAHAGGGGHRGAAGWTEDLGGPPRDREVQP